MSVNFEKQKGLDAQIARLELEILDLKRVRNQLSAISQLPTDVMTVIFSFSLQTLALHEEWTPLPDYVELGHICHAWRDIALSTPSLWTRMQIRANVKPGLLQFQLMNTKEAPLTIEYYSESKESSNLGAVSEIIRSVAGKRLRSLEIQTRDEEVSTLLEGTDECAEGLEELIVHDLTPYASSSEGVLYEDIFSGRTPNLRRLVLAHYILPWTSSILSSPNLTDLQIGSLYHRGSCQITRQYVSEFLAFLRHAVQLEKLTLHICGTKDEVGSGDAEWVPVEIPNLDYLWMVTTEPTPLITLLPLLILDAKIKSVHFSTDGARGTSEIAAMLSGLKHATGRLSAPQQVRLSHCLNRRSNREVCSVNMEGWRTPTLSSCEYPDAGPFIEELPWVNFKASPQTQSAGHRLDMFPFANPRDLDLDWWLSDVRTLIINNVDATPAFWTMLSKRPTIQFLSVTLSPGREDVHLTFYNALRGEISNRGDSSGRANLTPFSALRTLQVASQHISDPGAQSFVAAGTLAALQGRRGAFQGEASGKHPLDLEEVSFVNCASEIAREVLTKFLVVTEKVAWREKTKRAAPAPPQCIQVVRL